MAYHNLAAKRKQRSGCKSEKHFHEVYEGRAPRRPLVLEAVQRRAVHRDVARLAQVDEVRAVVRASRAAWDDVVRVDLVLAPARLARRARSSVAEPGALEPRSVTLVLGSNLAIRAAVEMHLSLRLKLLPTVGAYARWKGRGGVALAHLLLRFALDFTCALAVRRDREPRLLSTPWRAVHLGALGARIPCEGGRAELAGMHERTVAQSIVKRN
jgi:hypothetical protein